MKIIRESLLEFHKTGDIKTSLGIGRLSYIREWLEEVGISDYTINDDLSVDAIDVTLNNKNLEEFPDFIQFKVIKYGFFCGNNRLKSLRGGPSFVGRDFFCQGNLLESLEFSPYHVGKDFGCLGNRLKSLNGAPKFVGGYFYAGDNLKQFSAKDVTDVCRIHPDRVIL